MPRGAIFMKGAKTMYSYSYSLDPGLTPLIVILALLIALIPAIITGTLCRKLAEKKNLSGYFWTGFFLGILGLLYVGFLPNPTKN